MTGQAGELGPGPSLHGPVPGTAEIRHLRLQEAQGRLSSGSVQGGDPDLREPDVPVGVGLPHGLAVRRSRQPHPGELGDGLQKPIAGPARGLLHDDERSIHEAAEEVQDRGVVQGIASTNRLARIEVRSPGEDTQSPEEDLLVGLEERVTPLEGGGHGAVTSRHVPLPALQYRQHPVQAVRDLSQGQHPGSGGGEFERKGQTLESPAQGHDRRCQVRCQPEVGTKGRHPVHEQPDGLRREGLGGIHRPRRRNRHRGHGEEDLPAEAQWLPAGGDQTKLRAPLMQIPDQLRHRLRQVFAVVQDQRPRRPAEMPHGRLPGRHPGSRARPEGAAQRRGAAGRVGDRGPPHPMDRVELGPGTFKEGQDGTGLSGAPGPHDGDQALPGGQSQQVREDLAAAHEPGAGGGRCSGRGHGPGYGRAPGGCEGGSPQPTGTPAAIPEPPAGGGRHTLHSLQPFAPPPGHTLCTG